MYIHGKLYICLLLEIIIDNGRNASNNKALKISSINEGELITSVNFNYSGNHLAVGESNGRVKIFDIEK